MATNSSKPKNDVQILKQLESLNNQFNKTRFGLPEDDDGCNDVQCNTTAIEQLFDTINDGCELATVNSDKDCESEILSIIDHVNEYNDEIDSILLQSYSIIKNVFDNLCISTKNGNEYCCFNEVAILLKYSFCNIVLCYIFAIEGKIDEYFSFDQLSNDIYQQSIVNRILILKLLNKWYDYKCQSKFFDKYFESYKDKNRNTNNVKVQFFNERIESYYTYLLFSFEWVWDIFYSMFNVFDFGFNLPLFSNFNKKLRFNYDCIKTLEIFNQIIFDFRKYTKIFLMNKRYRKHSQTQSHLWIDIIQLDPNVYNYFLFENMILCNLLRYKCDEKIASKKGQEKDQEKEKGKEKQEQAKDYEQETKKTRKDKNSEEERDVFNQMLQVIQSLEQKTFIMRHEYIKFVNHNSILNIEKYDRIDSISNTNNSDINKNKNKNRWFGIYPTIFNIWQCMLNSNNCNHVCLLIFLTHIWHCISHDTNNQTQDLEQIQLEPNAQLQRSNKKHKNKLDGNRIIRQQKSKNNVQTNNNNKGNNVRRTKNEKNVRVNGNSDFKTEYKEEKDWNNLYDFRVFTATNNVNFVEPKKDLSNDILIFESNNCKIYRSKESKKHERHIWMKRGHGTLSIFYNKQRNILRLQFFDNKHKLIRLHQTFYPYFNYHVQSIGKGVLWFNTDYSIPKTPQTGVWKLTILSQEATQNAQAQQAVDNIEHIQFLNIIKDFYFGFGLPQFVEHAIKCKYGNVVISTKPNDYIWQTKEKIVSNLKLNNARRHLKQIYLLLMNDLLQYMDTQRQQQQPQQEQEERQEDGNMKDKNKDEEDLFKICSCQSFHFGDSLSYNVKLLIKYLFNYIDHEYQHAKHCRQEKESIQRFSRVTADRLINMVKHFNSLLFTLKSNWDYLKENGVFFENREDDIDNFAMFELSLNCKDIDNKWKDIIFKQLTFDRSDGDECCFACSLCNYITLKYELKQEQQAQAEAEAEVEAEADAQEEATVKAKTNAKAKAAERKKTKVETRGQKRKNGDESPKKHKNKKEKKNKKNKMTKKRLFNSFMQVTSNVDICDVMSSSPEINKNQNKNNNKNSINANINKTKSIETNRLSTFVFCLNANCKLRIELCYFWCMLQTELGGVIDNNRCKVALIALDEHIDVCKQYLPDKWRVSTDTSDANVYSNYTPRRINLNKNNCNNNDDDDNNGFVDSNWLCKMAKNGYFGFVSTTLPSYASSFLQLIFCANFGRMFDFHVRYDCDAWSLQQLVRHWLLPHLILKIKLVVKSKMYDKALNEINFVLKYIDSNNQFALQWKPNVIFCLQNINSNSRSRINTIQQKCCISPKCFKMAFTKTTTTTTTTVTAKTTANSRNNSIDATVSTGTNGGTEEKAVLDPSDQFCFPAGASITPTSETNVLAIFGGVNKSTNQFTNNLWIVNVNKRQSTLLSNGEASDSIEITPRFNHSAHLISNRKLFVIGGQFAQYNLYQRYHDISFRNKLSSIRLNVSNGCGDDRLLCSFDFYTKKWHVPQNVFMLHKRDRNGNVQLGNYVNISNLKNSSHLNFLSLLFLDVHCSVQLHNKEIYVFTTNNWNNFVINIENGTNNSRAIVKWTQLPKIGRHGDSSFKNANEFIISMNALYSAALHQIILIQTSNFLDTRVITLDPNYAKGSSIRMKSIGEKISQCNRFFRSVRTVSNTPWMQHIEPAFCPSRKTRTTTDHETEDTDFAAEFDDDDDEYELKCDIDDNEMETQMHNSDNSGIDSCDDYSMKFSQLCPKFDAILFDTRYFMINKNYNKITRKRANKEAQLSPKRERNFNKITDIRNSKIDKQYDYDCEKLFMSYQNYNFILKKLDKVSESYKRQHGFDLMDYRNEPTRVCILFHVRWTEKYDKNGNEDDYQYQRKSDFFMFNLLFYKANKAIKYIEKVGPRSIWRCGCNLATEVFFLSQAMWWNIDFAPKCLQQEKFPNAIRNVVETDNDNGSDYIEAKNRLMLLNNNYLILLDETNNFRFMGLKQNWMYYILNYSRMYHFQTITDVLHDSYIAMHCMQNGMIPPHLLTRTFTNIHKIGKLDNRVVVAPNRHGSSKKENKNHNNYDKNRNELIGYKVVSNRVETMIVRDDHIGDYNDSIDDDCFENEYFWLEDTQLLDCDKANFKASLYHVINYDSSPLVECSYCHCVELNPIYFRRCNKCNICVYCSSLCQQLHWDQCHSKYCKQINKFKFNKSARNVNSRNLLIKHGSRFGYKVAQNDICGINSLFMNEKKKNENETGMNLITNFLRRQEKEIEMNSKQVENNENEASIQEKIDKLCQQIEQSLLLSKKRKKKKRSKSNSGNQSSNKMNDNKKKKKNTMEMKKKKKKKRKKSKRSNRLHTGIEIAIDESENECHDLSESGSNEYDIIESDGEIEGKGERGVENDNDDDDIFQIEILNLPIMTKESDIANIFNIDENNIQMMENGDNVKCTLNLSDVQSIMQISIYHKKYKYKLSKECIIQHLFVSHESIVRLKQKYLHNVENKQQDFDAIFMLFKLCGVLTPETILHYN